MFSGIVAAVGRIQNITPREVGVRLTIDAGGLDLSDVMLGDSIACNGVCLTVVKRSKRRFKVDVSPESLSCTVGLKDEGEINLEKAMQVNDRLGGHIVSGHVDGVGEVVAFDPVGDNRLLVIRAPKALAHYIARKGSITVNGCSLTTNEVTDVRGGGADFSINLIPHTLKSTVLGKIQVGDRVNLEVDLIARYCERLLAGERVQNSAKKTTPSKGSRA